MIIHLKRLNKFLLILKVHYRELIIGDGALSLGWLVCKSLELGYDVHDMPYCLFPHLKNLFQIIMIAFLIQSTSRIMNPSAIYQFQPHCNAEFNKQIIENHIRKTKTKKTKSLPDCDEEGSQSTKVSPKFSQQWPRNSCDGSKPKDWLSKSNFKGVL